MRKYQPAWERIKNNKVAALTAPTNTHARIIQGIKKEKWRDRGWILMESEKGRRYRLTHICDGDMITFFLIDVSPISLEIL